MSPLRRGAALATASLLGLSLAGCSASRGSDGPTQTVEAFFHAIGAKDPAGACAQLSTGGQPLADAALDQCKEGMDKVFADVPDPSDFDKLKKAKVTGAQVTGDKATITAGQITDVPAGYANDIDLLKLGGRWFIDSKTDPADTDPADTDPTDTGPTG